MIAIALSAAPCDSNVGDHVNMAVVHRQGKGHWHVQRRDMTSVEPPTILSWLLCSSHLSLNATTPESTPADTNRIETQPTSIWASLVAGFGGGTASALTSI